MNSAYKQMPVNEQSRRLTQFVIGSQPNEFIGISIRPASFSAFRSKNCIQLILSKNINTYLDNVFIQSRKKTRKLYSVR